MNETLLAEKQADILFDDIKRELETREHADKPCLIGYMKDLKTFQPYYIQKDVDSPSKLIIADCYQTASEACMQLAINSPDTKDCSHVWGDTEKTKDFLFCTNDLNGAIVKVFAIVTNYDPYESHYDAFGVHAESRLWTADSWKYHINYWAATSDIGGNIIYGPNGERINLAL